MIVVANWLYTLDFNRVLVDKGAIAKLTDDEFKMLKVKICDLI